MSEGRKEEKEEEEIKKKRSSLSIADTLCLQLLSGTVRHKVFLITSVPDGLRSSRQKTDNVLK